MEFVMSTKKRQTNSLYFEWVRGVIRMYADTVKPHFTIKELAAYAGCTITPNLRKRLKQLVLEGELEFDYALVGKSGSCHVYTVVR